MTQNDTCMPSGDICTRLVVYMKSYNLVYTSYRLVMQQHALILRHVTKITVLERLKCNKTVLFRGFAVKVSSVSLLTSSELFIAISIDRVSLKAINI